MRNETERAFEFALEKSGGDIVIDPKLRPTRCAPDAAGESLTVF